MKTKYTPGPWTAVTHPEQKYFPHVQIGKSLPYSDNSGMNIDRITINEGASPEMVESGFGGGTTMDTADANARLIAAAPDLLTELHSLLYTPGNGVTPESHPSAVAAITKAISEGEAELTDG